MSDRLEELATQLQPSVLQSHDPKDQLIAAMYIRMRTLEERLEKLENELRR